MSILFYDTETTGFFNKKTPWNDPSQPHVVQLAAVLDDENGRTVSCMNVLVDCGVDVPEAAFNVHGVDREMTTKYGLEPVDALGMFEQILSKAELIVAHNVEFDHTQMGIMYSRHKPEEIVPLNGIKTFCTLLKTTPICKIPATFKGKGPYKWPSLDEAYRILVDQEGFSGAHDALKDVNACRAVYYALQNELGTEKWKR